MCPIADDTDSKVAVEAYMLNYFKALKTLEHTRDRYKADAANQQLPDSEQAVAVAAYLDMTSAIAHLTSAHERMLETYAGGVQAPPADLVRKTLALSSALARDIEAAQTAVAVLEVATRFVDAWTAILDAGNGAPEAAAGQPGAGAPPALADHAARLKTERVVRATNMEFLGLGHK